jgi:hypothetical protein
MRAKWSVCRTAGAYKRQQSRLAMGTKYVSRYHDSKKRTAIPAIAQMKSRTGSVERSGSAGSTVEPQGRA